MKNSLVKICLWLIILISGWALVAPGIFLTHDYVHGARIVEMARGLSDGQLPVRWSQNFGFGYGMPLFTFYAPLPYLVGALLWLAGLPLAWVVQFLFWLSTVILGLGTYKLSARRWGGLAGLVAASLAMLAPYRAVNIFVRGSLSELWGLMFIPWLLWAMDRIFSDKKAAVWPLATAVALLLLSHNLTAFLALPLVLIWFLMNLWEDARRTGNLKLLVKPVVKVAGGVLFGLGLAAFYVIPALAEKNLTQVDNLIVGGYFDYHLHYIYLRQLLLPNWGYGGSGWGVEDGLSFFLGWGQWAFLAMFFLSIFWRIKKRGKLSWKRWSLGLTLFVAFLINIWFATFKSQFVWEALSPLTYIQFPWRFLGPAALSLALLAGWWVGQKRFITISLISIVLLVATAFNLIYFRPASWQDYSLSHYYSDGELIRQNMSQILPDYLPLTLKADKLLPAKNLIVVPADSNQIEILQENSWQKLVRTKFSSPQEVVFALAAYPGWQLEIDGQVQPYQQSDLGLIKALVPDGESTVGLIWTETPLRRFADLVSLLSFFWLLSRLPLWRKTDE